MKATKHHISLETAKLLKNCGINSEKAYTKDGIINYNKNGYFLYLSTFRLPAFTWEEVLFEQPREFFADCQSQLRDRGRWTNHPSLIFDFLQDKKYKEADEYFRENCILIKK